MTPQKRASGRRPILALVCMLVLVAGLPMLSPTLNLFRPGGVPLGYVLVAQGIPLFMAALIAAFAWDARDA